MRSRRRRRRRTTSLRTSLRRHPDADAALTMRVTRNLRRRTRSLQTRTRTGLHREDAEHVLPVMTTRATRSLRRRRRRSSLTRTSLHAVNADAEEPKNNQHIFF